jgi:hypothetical protein
MAYQKDILKLSETSSEKNIRFSDYKINSLLLNRWSPRSMSDEPIDETTLMSLFVVARWAQSSSNSHPWRFRYSTRESKDWGTF